VLSSKHAQGNDFFFIYDRPSGVNVAMADGSVKYLRPGSVSTEELWKILQVGGYGEEAQDRISSRPTAPDGEPRLNWPNIASLAVWLLSVGTLLIGAVRSRQGPPAQKANDGYCAAITKIV